MDSFLKSMIAIMVLFMIISFSCVLYWEYYEPYYYSNSYQTTFLVEKAYFEGQKDALNGVYKVAKENDSTYRWIESLWDNNRQPFYKP